jgi:hypothetical protein
MATEPTQSNVVAMSEIPLPPPPPPPLPQTALADITEVSDASTDFTLADLPPPPPPPPIHGKFDSLMEESESGTGIKSAVI